MLLIEIISKINMHVSKRSCNGYYKNISDTHAYRNQNMSDSFNKQPISNDGTVHRNESQIEKLNR